MMQTKPIYIDAWTVDIVSVQSWVYENDKWVYRTLTPEEITMLEKLSGKDTGGADD